MYDNMYTLLYYSLYKLILLEYLGNTMSVTDRNWKLSSCNLEKFLAERTAPMQNPTMHDMLKLRMVPNVISLAGGLPAPEMFPMEAFHKAFDWMATQDPELLFQYSPTEGLPYLKNYLIESMDKFKLPLSEDNVLLVNGSQQSLDLLGRIFINKGDKIITESATYLGAIQAFDVYRPEYITIPMDDDGMRMDELERALQANPGVKFIYVLSTFHNPAGTTLPLDRRTELVRLALKYNTLIIEDDPYSELRFEGKAIPPIISLNWGNTIYLNSFSKILSPGIRLGWIIAPKPIINQLVMAKQSADMHNNNLVQLAVYGICRQGELEPHIRALRPFYQNRRDVMIRAIQEYLPPEFVCNRPEGGLFLWITMPPCVNSDDLLNSAVKENVAFVPARTFYPGGIGKPNYMRLNYSYMPPDRIEEGIKRLGRAISNYLSLG